MPILQLPTNPSPTPGQTPDQAPDKTGNSGPQRIKVRTGRYGDLEEHELIHLLDSIDDEVSRARFRESIYKSIIICMAVAWFLFYGPRVLFHQPELRDPIALMKQHDKEQVTFLNPPNVPAPKPPPRPVIDRKTMQQIQQAAPTPLPPTPQPPQEEAHNTPPPPPPLPSAPKPQPSIDAPLPAAPRPNIAQNSGSARDSVLNAARDSMGARTQYGPPPGSSAPLQAGAEILSDTMGVDFSAYMRRLHADIQRNWDPLIPEEVEPPLRKRGITGIRFSILPDGQIGNMTLETPSGDVALDRAAWNAITSEGQFPPLPKEFHGPLLELRCGFFYNTPIQQ
jgi:TonB family protein